MSKKDTSVDLSVVTASDEYLALKTNQERIDYLVDEHGIKSAVARDYVKEHGATARRIDYPMLVNIIRHAASKKDAIDQLVENDVCSQKTGEHLWSARAFAIEYAKQEMEALKQE